MAASTRGGNQNTMVKFNKTQAAHSKQVNEEIIFWTSYQTKTVCRCCQSRMLHSYNSAEFSVFCEKQEVVVGRGWGRGVGVGGGGWGRVGRKGWERYPSGEGGVG